MQQREIGKTKLKIDTLGLGCAPLGGNFVDLTYNQGAELVNAALDAGISYFDTCLLYTSPSPRDGLLSRMPSSA